MNKLKNGVFITYVTVFVQMLVSFFCTPVIIKFLGQSEYGVYQIALSIVAYISTLNAGLSHAYIHFHSIERAKSQRNKIKQLTSTYALIMCLISVVVFVLGCLTAKSADLFLNDSLSSNEILLCKSAIVILSFNAAIGMLSYIFESYFLVFEMYGFHKVVNCLHIIATSVISMLLLYNGGNLYSLLKVTVFITFIKLCFVGFYSFKALKMPFGFKAFDKELFNPMFAFSAYLFVNLVADQINWSVDRFILGVVLGANSAAVYGVASQLQMIFLQIMTVIPSVFLTKVNNMIAEGTQNEKISELFINVGKIQFLVAAIINIGFFTFGEAFIDFWAGDGYEESFIIAVVLFVSSTPLYIQNLGMEIQRAKNMHKFRAYLYIAMCVVNIVLTVILVRLFGTVGAAIATGIVIVIGEVFVINIYYQKKMNLDIKSFWMMVLKTLPSLIPAIVFGVIIKIIVRPNDFLSALPYILGMCCVYFVSVLLFGFNKKERKVLFDIIRNSKKR